MRFALSFLVAALMASGCGGPQGHVTPLGALPSNITAASHEGQGTRRMLPRGSGGLIYAVGGCDGTCVVSYPDGQFVGALPTGGSGICSDGLGNVFISDDSDVVEYAHGGATPIATLSLPGDLANGCSVDSRTNNLAVVFRGKGTDIAIFPNEAGSPALYASNIISYYCGYDSSGNLFVDGYIDKSGPQPALAELRSGGTTFTPLTIDPYIGEPGQVQWDGKYITYEAVDTGKIKRLKISDSNATVTRTISLRRVDRGAGASWISGDSVVVPFRLRGATNKTVGVWKYARGGKAMNLIKRFGIYKPSTIRFQGVAVSAKPS